MAECGAALEAKGRAMLKRTMSYRFGGQFKSRVVVWVFMSAIAACSSSSDDSSNMRNVGGSSANAGSGGGNATGGDTGLISDKPIVTAGSGDNNANTGGAMEDACPAVSKTTEPGLAAVDIVWAVDGSGSMSDEAQRLQDNIQAFVDGIAAAGVDTRVVFLSQTDLVPAGSQLAQGGNYLWLEDMVDSTNALDRLIARYPDYQGFLRPDSHVHFIIVTDDESDYMGLGTPTARADAFQSDMDGLLSNEYTIHAVASPGAENELPCAPESIAPEVVQCCRDYILSLFIVLPAGCDAYPEVTALTCPFMGGAARNGVTYFMLADRTGGVGTSICAEDWTNVFGSLQDAVVASAPLPCSYAIPAPPSGTTFDKMQVNVKYTPSGSDPANSTPYPNVADVADCGDNQAWYYDPPGADIPEEVVLCPAACEAANAAKGGMMDVVFGCPTVPLL